MVNVLSSKGNIVRVEIYGINEAIRHLQNISKEIEINKKIELIQQANFVRNEVQESIIGNRLEKKSVDTGTLGNNIQIKLNNNSAIIYPTNKRYNNSNTTVSDVALYLEYGTSKITARRHFRNTKSRVENKIINNFKIAVNKSLK